MFFSCVIAHDSDLTVQSCFKNSSAYVNHAWKTYIDRNELKKLNNAKK